LSRFLSLKRMRRKCALNFARANESQTKTIVFGFDALPTLGFCGQTQQQEMSWPRARAILQVRADSKKKTICARPPTSAVLINEKAISHHLHTFFFSFFCLNSFSASRKSFSIISEIISSKEVEGLQPVALRTLDASP